MKWNQKNVTDIVLTWSGEKFVNRPISWSNFSKLDILAALLWKKNILQKCDTDKCSVDLHVSHDKGSDKDDGLVPVLRDLEWTCTFNLACSQTARDQCMDSLLHVRATGLKLLNLKNKSAENVTERGEISIDTWGSLKVSPEFKEYSAAWEGQLMSISQCMV